MAGRGTDIVLGGTLEPLILKLRDDETLLPTEKEREIAKMRADAAKRVIRIEQQPAGISLAAGRACLTAHAHAEDRSSKFWQRNFRVRGDLMSADDGWVLVPRQVVGGFEVSSSLAVTTARNARKIWRFQRRARREQARRTARSHNPSQSTHPIPPLG